jgi:hypothetical protein
MKRAKTIAFAILALAILILLSGCTQDEKKEATDGTPGGQGTGDTGGTSEQQPEIVPLQPEKTLDQKLADCAAFEQLKDRDSCYAALAIAERNSAVCERIAGTSTEGKTAEDQTKECKAAVARMLAIDSKDYQNCLKLEIDFDKWACLKAIAMEKRQDALCAQITDTLKRFDCYTAVAEVAGDEKICDWITTSSVKNNCIALVAAKKKDQGLCFAIETVAEKENCLVKVATATKNAEICNLLTLAPYKEQCIKTTG